MASVPVPVAEEALTLVRENSPFSKILGSGPNTFIGHGIVPSSPALESCKSNPARFFEVPCCCCCYYRPKIFPWASVDEPLGLRPFIAKAFLKFSGRVEDTVENSWVKI